MTTGEGNAQEWWRNPPPDYLEVQGINTSVHVLALRQEIGELFRREEYDAIGELPGFTVVVRKDERPPQEGCFEYVSWALQVENVYECILRGEAHRVNNPSDFREGDAVLYRWIPTPDASSEERGYFHVGLAKANGNIRSKFGWGHVYEHPESAIPVTWGNITERYQIVQPRDS